MTVLDPGEILSIHKGYADQFSALATSGLTAAFAALSNSAIFQYNPAQIAIAFPDIGSAKSVGSLPNLPSNPTIAPLGNFITYVDIPNDQTGNAPVAPLSGVPTFVPPTTPNTSAPTFNAVAPPDPNPLTLPPVPSYLALPGYALPYPTVNVPVAPTISTATFDGVKPGPLAPLDPNSLVTNYQTERQSRLGALPTYAAGVADSMIAKYAPEFASLRAQINAAIIAYTSPSTGGGIGLPTQIEGAILARNTDRNVQEFNRAVNTALDTVAKRGFSLPTGVVQGGLLQARMAMGDAQVRGSTDVALKNVELEQKNFQFMFELGEKLEEKMLDTVTGYLNLSLQIDQQSIASAKEIVATFIGAYNLQVMVFRAMYDGYQADAEVYKAKIEGLLANVQLYEAQIKAELAKVEINKATVDVLRVVASVNQSLADAYKTQVEAATATLEISRLQVAVFEAKARAYASQGGAYESQWNAYRSQVDGALAPFKGYEAQIQGFVAQVQAYQAQVAAFEAKVRAVSEQNKSVTSFNEGQVRVYTAQADAAIKIYEGQVAGYSAQSSAIIKQSEIEVEYWRTKANIIFQEYNVAVNQTFEYAREQMNLFRGQMEAAITAANGLAHAAGTAGILAGGAMGGLTSLGASVVTSTQ